MSADRDLPHRVVSRAYMPDTGRIEATALRGLIPTALVLLAAVVVAQVSFYIGSIA